MSFGEDINTIVEKDRSGLLAKHPSWERVNAGAVIHLYNGFAFKSDYFNTKEGIPLLRIRDILKGRIETFYSGPLDPKICYVEKGDILIGMDGDFNTRIWAAEKALLNQRVCKIAAKEDCFDQKFLSYLLPGYLAAIHAQTSSVTVKHLSSNTIKEIPLPLPPLNEQKRIVDRIEQLFSDLDEGEALLKTVQKQLATYRQSVLKAAVTGELTKDWREKNKKKLESGEKLFARILESRRKNWKGKGKYKEPSDIDEPYFEIPDGWALTQLETISQRVTDGTHQSPKFQESGVPFVVIGDVRGGFIDWDSVSKWVSEETYEDNTRRCRPEKDDILYTAVGSYGIALRVKDKKKFMFQRHIAHIKPIQGMLNLDYIVFVLNSPTTLSHAHKVARGVAQKTVTLGELSNFQIPIPPREEQEIIVDRVSHALSQIDAFESLCTAELKRSATLRQSILKSAFSGKLVTQNPTDEPANELLARIKSDDIPKAKIKAAAPRRGRKPRSDKTETAQIKHKQKKVRRA